MILQPVCSICQSQVDNLRKLGELDIVQDDEGAVDPGDRLVGDPGLGDVVPGDGRGLVHQALPHGDGGGHYVRC